MSGNSLQKIATSLSLLAMTTAGGSSPWGEIYVYDIIDKILVWEYDPD